jgi:hypothetical protein
MKSTHIFDICFIVATGLDQEINEEMSVLNRHGKSEHNRKISMSSLYMLSEPTVHDENGPWNSICLLPVTNLPTDILIQKKSLPGILSIVFLVKRH